MPVVLDASAPQSRPPTQQVTLAQELGHRMLMPDRPGSAAPPAARTHRGLVDAAALMDALVDRFAVAGGSGGGPYAVACGVLLGERVIAAALAGRAAERPWS